ncbi:hypothetical protein ASE89_11170 [Sphingomonas sp. Leaf30]|nr:hypothetical protein ASE89_11170 [Sphingomonas sp. Leaf30]
MRAITDLQCPPRQPKGRVSTQTDQFMLAAVALGSSLAAGAAAAAGWRSALMDRCGLAVAAVVVA